MVSSYTSVMLRFNNIAFVCYYAYPRCMWAKVGHAPGWVASSLQRPTWAFGGSVHCSRLPQQCSEGLNREVSPIDYRMSCLPLTVFHQLSKNILSLIHVTITTNIMTSRALFQKHWVLGNLVIGDISFEMGLLPVWKGGVSHLDSIFGPTINPGFIGLVPIRMQCEQHTQAHPLISMVTPLPVAHCHRIVPMCKKKKTLCSEYGSGY